MRIKNKERIVDIILFCCIYQHYRDFVLSKNIAKLETLSWDKAESVANLCNSLIKTKEAKPTDFIKTDDEKSNDVIEKYTILKKYLKLIKDTHSTEKRNYICKAVKSFYRKKTFCYQMDSFFCTLAYGTMLYINGIIEKNEYNENYFWEYSLFDGSKKNISKQQVFRIINYINQHLKNAIKNKK